MKQPVRIAFDPRKSEENYRKHGQRLEDFHGFDEAPLTIPDMRRNYDEPRWRSFGRIDGLGYDCIYSARRRGPLDQFSSRT